MHTIFRQLIKAKRMLYLTVRNHFAASKYTALTEPAAPIATSTKSVNRFIQVSSVEFVARVIFCLLSTRVLK